MKVYYVADVMCGWCFGFHGVVDKLKKNYGSKVPFEILVGNLFGGEYGVQLNPEIIGKINDADAKIEELTGVKFGENFRKNILGKAHYEMNSEPASLAMIAVKAASPEKQFELLDAIHTAFYVEGKDITKLDVLIEAWESIGLEKEKLLKHWSSEETKKEYELEKAKIKAVKAEVYPSLILEEKGTHCIMSTGYETYENLSKILEKAIQKGNNK